MGNRFDVTEGEGCQYYWIAFIDEYSRYLVSWELLSSMDATSVSTAAQRAIETLPLDDHGKLLIKLWTRKKFKGTNALQGKGITGGKYTINMTRIPIEKKESIRWLENVRESTSNLGDAERCVHIGDRESDIYKLFCECQSLGTNFVFRTCVNRRSNEGAQTVDNAMVEQHVKAVHRVEVKDRHGKASTAVLEMKYQRLELCPPIGKEKRYGNLTLTVNRTRDAPPGNMVPWRGMARLTDIHLGYCLSRIVGN